MPEWERVTGQGRIWLPAVFSPDSEVGAKRFCSA